MNIVSVCIVGVVSAALALMVRRYSPEQALFLSIGAGALILLSVIRETVSAFSSVSSLLYNSNINPEYIVILLKTLGICFLTEFSCDAVTEAGMLSLSSNILLSGKILVLITALPLFTELFTTVTALLSG